MSLGVGAAGACGGGAVQRMQVAVPHDIEPGQVFEVQTPGGRMRVTYPLAAVAGETILIDVPRTQRMSPPTATSRPDASRSGEYLAARRASNATYEAEAALRREGDAEDSLALQLGIAASLHDLDRETATETDEEVGRRLAQAVSGSELDARHADRVRTADRLVRGMMARDAAAAAMGGASHAQARVDMGRPERRARPRLRRIPHQAIVRSPLERNCRSVRCAVRPDRHADGAARRLLLWLRQRGRAWAVGV